MWDPCHCRSKLLLGHAHLPQVVNPTLQVVGSVLQQARRSWLLAQQGPQQLPPCLPLLAAAGQQVCQHPNGWLKAGAGHGMWLLHNATRRLCR